MCIRKYWAALALAHCALPLGWAVKLGEAVPDMSLRDCSGAEVRLSAYHQKRQVVVLVEAPGAKLAPAVLDETCRDLAARDTVVLLLAGDATENRRLLETDPPATLLVDSSGVVRRVLAGRALAGPDLAGFVKLWEFGKTVFNAECARCHGEDGDLHICEDVKPLVGIGRRLTEAQIREKLRMAAINDQYLIRGQMFTKQEIDAAIVYVAGL
jgi:cytochrome c553